MLKLKLARLKLVAPVLGKILLAGEIQNKS